jgi:uncharacterized membrane protein HdeD (DUF308 family)
MPEEIVVDQLLKKSWWMLALRGVAAILFGILALIWPNLTLLVLVAFFAAYAFITAGASIYAAVQNRKTDKGWWLILLLGLVAFAAGVLAIIYPAVTALVLVLLMGANALVSGVLDVAVALRLRKAIRNEWLLILTGVISMVFGVLVMIFPGAGALAMVWLVSFYAVLTGVLLLALAIRMRSAGTTTSGTGTTGSTPGAGSKDRLAGA